MGVDIQEHGGICLDDEHGGTIGYPDLTLIQYHNRVAHLPLSLISY